MKSCSTSCTVGALVGAIFGALFVIVILGSFAYERGQHSIRIEAAEHGYAEWVTDTAGNSTFRWIERKDESEGADAE